MQAVSHITRKCVNTDKECYNLAISVTGANSEKKLLDMVKEFNKIVVKAGGQTTLDSKTDDED